MCFDLETSPDPTPGGFYDNGVTNPRNIKHLALHDQSKVYTLNKEANILLVRTIKDASQFMADFNTPNTVSLG
jgi:hypothetical protein